MTANNYSRENRSDKSLHNNRDSSISVCSMGVKLPTRKSKVFSVWFMSTEAETSIPEESPPA